MPSHHEPISDTAMRLLLSAACDAGISAAVGSHSVRNDGERVVITLSARQVRALTEWFSLIADHHREEPIEVCTLAPTGDINATTTDTPPGEVWWRDVLSERDVPVGYIRARIPTTIGGSGEGPQARDHRKLA
jgi:hypothetical protein